MEGTRLFGCLTHLLSWVVLFTHSLICSSYVIPDIVVSSLHCKIHAVQSSTGGVIVSCQDLSTNGLILNGHKIRKTSVIVMNGDTFRIPASQTFQCILKWRHLHEKHEKHTSQPSQSQTQSYKVATVHQNNILILKSSRRTSVDS